MCLNSAYVLKQILSIPCSAGKLSVTKALDLTLYLRKETEITPALKGLDELNQMYKLLEKRDLTDTKKQLEVNWGRIKTK